MGLALPMKKNPARVVSVALLVVFGHRSHSSM